MQTCEKERLIEALKPFAALYEYFSIRAPLRPQTGEIASWVDHRIGERVITVEHLKAAHDALLALREGAGDRPDQTTSSEAVASPNE